MKTLNKLLLIGLSAGIIACGSTEEADKSEEKTEQIEVTEEVVDLSGMEELSLLDYQLDASIFIPNDKKPEVLATDWGSIEIKVGKNFGLEILPLGISIIEFKEQLATDLVYKIEYIEESENLIIFKKSIEGSDIKAEYHFFMNLESDGDIYEVKSLAEMTFTKLSIEKMVKAAKSFKLK